MATVMLERMFDEPVTDEAWESMLSAAGPCFEVNGVSRVTSYRGPERKRFICVLEAADAESVRRALDTLGVTYERVWTATQL